MFKYLGAIICDERSKPEIPTRAAQTVTALGNLKTTCKDKNITLKYRIDFCARCFILFYILPLSVRNMDPQSRATEEDTSDGNETLL